MAVRSGSRSGFTLIELLVVIAIIAVLIGLLLPAVQKVREAAARSQCINNLKQIGVAVQSYHGAFEAFPTGAADGNGSGSINPAYGWCVFILPFMEQDNLFNRLSPKTRTLATVFSTDLAALQIPVKTFICPSDLGSPSNPGGTLNGNRPFTQGKVALSNYPGNGGNAGGDGIFAANSLVRIKDVTDGLSNTFLAGERDSSNSRYAAVWCGESTSGGTVVGITGLIGYTEYRMMDGYTAYSTGAAPAQAFGSAHPSGANFLLCDGSARFINQGIAWGDTLNSGASQTYNALGTRNGGEVVGSY
jgi:prepilin-type N-terminal cleavage/methylation domain-containing protein/prepilin-type processing-associated H-X9-DG protein